MVSDSARFSAFRLGSGVTGDSATRFQVAFSIYVALGSQQAGRVSPLVRTRMLTWSLEFTVLNSSFRCRHSHLIFPVMGGGGI